MNVVSRPEFRRRVAEALEALVVVETQRLEVERGILNQLYLMRDKTPASIRLFLGRPIPQ